MRGKSFGLRGIMNLLKFSLKKILILRKLSPKAKIKLQLAKEIIVSYLPTLKKERRPRGLKLRSPRMILLISAAINNQVRTSISHNKKILKISKVCQFTHKLLNTWKNQKLNR